MIVVVGGTGRLGRLVLERLAERGAPARAVARSTPVPPLPEGTDFVVADARDALALEASLAGASVVVSAIHGMDPGKDGSPADTDRDGNIHLFDAAARQGAAVVLVSVIGAAPDHPMELYRMKWAAEQRLRASGTRWTIVRASAFAQMWQEILARTARSSGRPVIFGRGVNPVNFVSVPDVAAAVARAATDESLRGAVIEVGGPANLTLTHMADMVAPGRKPRHVPRAALRAVGVLAGPVRPGVARIARTGLAMDTGDQRFDPGPSLTAYPWLTSTVVEPRKN
jgi:NADH dehydrogenase